MTLQEAVMKLLLVTPCPMATTSCHKIGRIAVMNKDKHFIAQSLPACDAEAKLANYQAHQNYFKMSEYILGANLSSHNTNQTNRANEKGQKAYPYC